MARSSGFAGTAGAEVWEIGLVPMPTFVVEAGGAIRASEVGHHDRPLEVLEAAVAQAIDHPQPPAGRAGPGRWW